MGLSGGSGAGKTTLARAAVSQWPELTHLALDRYYRDLTRMSPRERGKVNFDHPGALETELLADHLGRFRAGEAIDAPLYDFATHTRAGYERLEPGPVVLLEGTLVYAIEAIQPLIDLRVFIDAPADLRLLRRLRRDVTERGRTFEFSADQYLRAVRPMHQQFVEPYKTSAGCVLDGEQPVESLIPELLTRLRAFKTR